jgi:hypothetical protein
MCRTGSGSPAARIRGGSSLPGSATRRKGARVASPSGCNATKSPFVARLPRRVWPASVADTRRGSAAAAFGAALPLGPVQGIPRADGELKIGDRIVQCGAHLRLGALADCGSDRVDALTSSYLCQRAGPTGPRPVERQYRIRRHGSQRPADLPPPRRREALRLAPATARARQAVCRSGFSLAYRTDRHQEPCTLGCISSTSPNGLPGASSPEG